MTRVNLVSLHRTFTETVTPATKVHKVEVVSRAMPWLRSPRKRPVHLGPYPLEDLPRLNNHKSLPPGVKKRRGLSLPSEKGDSTENAIGNVFGPFSELLDHFRVGPITGDPAPLPSDPEAVSNHLKAWSYFQGAHVVGICSIPEVAWLGPAEHLYGLMVLVAHEPPVSPDEAAAEYLLGTQQELADLRAARIAVVTANYLRRLGFGASAHTVTETDVDLYRAGLQAGVLEIRSGGVRHPLIKGGFALAMVSTNLELIADAPLARSRITDWTRNIGLSRALGRHGTRPKLAMLNHSRRLRHFGQYPMERLRRVATPTVLMYNPKRMPVRATFMQRALYGDLGPILQKRRQDMNHRTPTNQAFNPLIGAMVPLQTGEVAETRALNCDDPEKNSVRIKSTAHYLGADVVGVCEVPAHAYYSHDTLGEPITPEESNAVVIMLDSHRDTTDGSSGDDWITGTQRLSEQLRGAEIASLLAAHIRQLGFEAEAHTEAAGSVRHVPLMLAAGLGELSRIGDVVVNPFIGPSQASVVVTTNMPLQSDKPVDFGLQDICSKCKRCARECPSDAISFGERRMLDGVEQWTRDFEKCTTYVLDNPGGSGCTRCVKVCPFDAPDTVGQRMWVRAAISIPLLRKRFIARADRLGHGEMEPAKKWWIDLESIRDSVVHPRVGTNARSLALGDDAPNGEGQILAVYPADSSPEPGTITPVRIDRRAGVTRFNRLPSADEARRAYKKRVRSR